jgi:hypothetical protein
MKKKNKKNNMHIVPQYLISRIVFKQLNLRSKEISANFHKKNFMRTRIFYEDRDVLIGQGCPP